MFVYFVYPAGYLILSKYAIEQTFFDVNTCSPKYLKFLAKIDFHR